MALEKAVGKYYTRDVLFFLHVITVGLRASIISHPFAYIFYRVMQAKEKERVTPVLLQWQKQTCS